MPLYTVVTPLLNGGEEPIAPGDTVELNAREGKALTAIGAVTPAPAKKSAEKPAGAGA